MSLDNFLDDVVGIDPGGGGIFDAAGKAAPFAAAIPGVGPILSAGLKGVEKLGDVYADLNKGGGFADDVLGIDPSGGGIFDERTGNFIGAATDAYGARQQRDAANRAAQLQAQGVEQARQDVLGAGTNALERLAQGAQAQRDVIGQTYDQAGNLISPLAGQAQQFTDEQMALLGLSGPEAMQAAMSRVSDPLVAEQERAFLRNQAALGGGVGMSGNILSALAEQTRNRTQANIGTRLNQLQSASTPALNALQQLTQQTLGRGQAMQGVEREAAVAPANALLAQGGQLAQLAQNLGTARAGGAAFRAGQVSPTTQGVQSLLGGIAATPPPSATPPPDATPVAMTQRPFAMPPLIPQVR